MNRTFDSIRMVEAEGDAICMKSKTNDIYDLLNRAVVNNSIKLTDSLFRQEDRERLNDHERTMFDLLRNISSIGIRVSNSSVEFYSRFVMSDGGRSFSIEDISDADFEKLTKLEFDKIPLILRVMIADILWVQKRDFQAAKVAATGYWDLFKIRYGDDYKSGSFDMICRALCISVQTKQSTIYDEICSWLDELLKSEAIYKDVFYSLRIMDLFASQKSFDVSPFLDVLEEMIRRNYDNVSKIEQVYNFKSKCLYKLKRNEDARKNNLLLSDYYLDWAEKLLKRDAQDVMRVGYFYQKGINLYRNNGEAQKAEIAHKRLVEIQKDIPKTMMSHTIELNIEEIVKTIRKNMDGLSFEESIIRLTQMIVFDKKDEIKKRMIEEYKNYPLSHLFKKNLINDYGQTVLVLPSLDLSNPEGDLRLLELHMQQSLLEKQKITGDIVVKNALVILREKFTIEKSMLKFLVKDNPIIPEGRDHIFLSGLCMFLKGEYFEAMHLLAPQTENLFRNIAREVGGLTVTLERDGSSMEKVLSSIFSLPELLDSYDNDILFIFKGLLNEQAGANIRNEIAHGIISENACSSGACLFFGVAIIKLLSLTSLECYRIKKESEMLRQFEMPSRDALKIIQNESIN